MFVYNNYYNSKPLTLFINYYSVTGGELFDDIVAREFYSEKDAR